MASSDHELNISSSTLIPSPIHTRTFRELRVIHRSENPIFSDNQHLRKKADSNRRPIAVRFTTLIRYWVISTYFILPPKWISLI
jgi:hypothetical protein